MTLDEGTRLLDGLVTEGWTRLQGIPVEERPTLLGRVGVRLLEPSDPLRIQALEALPAEAGLSPEAALEVLEGMAREWVPPRLRHLLRCDFPDSGVLEGFRRWEGDGRVQAVPPRLLVQIGAGSVPGTGATALLRGLLVGAPTLLKPGRGDGDLSRIVARALEEEVPELVGTFAVKEWKGGGGGVLEAEALQRADRVVVYGGWDTVQALRRQVPAEVPVVAYGHRLSLGVVMREALVPNRGRELARSAAVAISAYDQRGCVSPQMIWVEEGGQLSADQWARLLGEELDQRAAEVPPFREPTTLGAMRQLHDAAELRELSGASSRVLGGPREGWMVLVESDPTPVPSCLGRTVRIHPIPNASQVPELLAPFRHLLQSCALEGGGSRREEELAGKLARAGVTRITTFRQQPWPPPSWRHDGEGPLRSLVRWVEWEEGQGPPPHPGAA